MLLLNSHARHYYMDPERYTSLLGSLVANFHALEFVLRAYLSKLPTTGALGIPIDTHYYEHPVGSELGIDPFTSYDSLGELIDKVNLHLRASNLPEIDRTLIEVRDAIAHGRVSAPNASRHQHLIKFDRVDKSGKVRVVFNQELTEDWLSNQKRKTFETVNFILTHMPA